jgi:asparagine synthase (glutamine-hydrolysing)
MCGISSIATFGATPASADVLQRMTDRLAHRGPDDQGCFREPRGRALLGHRRLSIIDLSSGHQPVFNEDRSIAIVFNGEIYNFQEMRDELERKGHHFTTRSDTEVIVHLYEEYGEACVSRLRGMFAFAIWDGRRDAVFVARDRVGKKPVYYAVAGETLYLASEIQALYGVPDIPRDLDYQAIDLYLTYSYVPAPWSIYKSIRKLPPAHTLTFHRTGLTTARYWHPRYEPKISLDYEEAKAELVRILTESVRLRLISDVPLGAFLSGGVDSATVVAIMSRLSPRPVQTFSIGFPDAEYNELGFASDIARRYHTEHHEFMVEPERLDILGDLVRHYGEPYGDSSAVPTWHLSRITRQKVTVALNGDGGDELFGGYPWYEVLHGFNRAANPLTRGGAALLHRIGNGVIPRRARRGLEILALDERSRFRTLRSFMDARARATLYHDEFRRQAGDCADTYLPSLYDLSLQSDYDRAFAADFVSYLPEDLLVKVDRASMAHSLECRSPFLDQELVAFAAVLPPHWKIDGGRTKKILKDAVADWFPPGFVERRKMGFSVPIGRWFRGELKPFLKDKVLNGPLRRMPLLRMEALERLLDEHFEGAGDHETRIWNVLMLSLWFEEYGSGR